MPLTLKEQSAALTVGATSGTEVYGKSSYTKAGGGGGSSNSFETISTSSGTAPVADSATDTLTMTGEHIDVVGDSSTDTINYKGINRIRWAMFLMGG